MEEAGSEGDGVKSERREGREGWGKGERGWKGEGDRGRRGSQGRESCREGTTEVELQTEGALVHRVKRDGGR